MKDSKFLLISFSHMFMKFESCTIRSAVTENPGLEPNTEWIGCTICEILAFKLSSNLGTGLRGCSHSSSIVNMPRVKLSEVSSMKILLHRIVRVLMAPAYCRSLELKPRLSVD